VFYLVGNDKNGSKTGCSKTRNSSKVQALTDVLHFLLYFFFGLGREDVIVCLNASICFLEISQLALPLSQHEDCNCFYRSLLYYHHLFIIQWMPGSQRQTGLTLPTSEPFLKLFNGQLYSNMIYD